MKRFFTFLMAVWALLSISQTVKAVDFCIMGTFTGEDRANWAKLDGKNMDLVGPISIPKRISVQKLESIALDL